MAFVGRTINKKSYVFAAILKDSAIHIQVAI
jgi:hypothetical protein